MSQYSLSVLCHFVALPDCIRSGYVGGQLVITLNILSSFFHHNLVGSPSELNFAHPNGLMIMMMMMMTVVTVLHCIALCSRTMYHNWIHSVPVKVAFHDDGGPQVPGRNGSEEDRFQRCTTLHSLRPMFGRPSRYMCLRCRTDHTACAHLRNRWLYDSAP